LKIFLAFQQSENVYPIPAYDFWQRYIKNGITEAGHEWTECPGADWALGLVAQPQNAHAKWKQTTWEKTIASLKKNPVDIFLSYLYPAQVDESAIKEIQKMGISCVNFFCDNVREFTKAPSEFKTFNLNWVPEHKAVKFYQSAGYKYIQLPMPVWIPPGDRIIAKEQYHQVTFLGSKDIQRQILLEDIIKLQPDLQLAIYGSGWNQTARQLNPVADNYTLFDSLLHQFAFIKRHGIKAYTNKIKSRKYSYGTSPALLTKYKGGHQFEDYKILTAASTVTVGINRYPSYHFPLYQPDTYSRLRDIEAPMFGACYLTEWTQGIEDLYEIGHEIEVYHDAAEFIEKAKELIADPAKRKTLKVNGQKRALNDHNITSSLNKIITSLNI
jgi:hypothetical protein